MKTAYDAIIIGGGTAGVIAAVQAGRAGVQTLLVEKGEILGGTLTKAGISSPVSGMAMMFVLPTIRSIYTMPAPTTEKRSITSRQSSRPCRAVHCFRKTAAICLLPDAVSAQTERHFPRCTWKRPAWLLDRLPAHAQLSP